MTNYEKIKQMSIEDMADEIDWFFNREVSSCTDQCQLCPAEKICGKRELGEAMWSCSLALREWLNREVEKNDR